MFLTRWASHNWPLTNYGLIGRSAGLQPVSNLRYDAVHGPGESHKRHTDATGTTLPLPSLRACERTHQGHVGKVFASKAFGASQAWLWR